MSEPSEEESIFEGFDIPLYFATTCEEQSFPFSRSSSPATRRAEALATARALPADTFFPFTYSDALRNSDVGVCSAWPYSTQGPELDEAPLPSVPTLILSGEDDIRTPTSNARALASQIPGAHLLVVPHTGHSVLGATLGDCPRNGLQAFFDNKPIKACTGEEAPPRFPPIPLAPRRLAQIAPLPGTHGPGGRALTAVVLTVNDFTREFALQLLSAITHGHFPLALLQVQFGGLRGGWAKLSRGTLHLHDYTYVPDVRVSGAITSGHGTLRISGSRRTRGTLHVGKHGRLTGVLGGQRVSGTPPASDL